MSWVDQYPAFSEPTIEDMSLFVDNPLWDELVDYLEESYNVEPKIQYSSCSMQEGWNAKFSRKGKSLCTLYPLSGYFLALVVIGSKEEPEAELLLPSLSQQVQDLYDANDGSSMGRWLMVEVKDERALSDVMSLIEVRMKPVIA